MKRFPFRIYRSHDYDLMLLTKSGALDIYRAVQMALKAELSGDTDFTLTPDQVPAQTVAAPMIAYVQVSIPDELWALILQVPSGARCSWIKNLLRKYLKGNGMAMYCAGKYAMVPKSKQTGSAKPARPAPAPRPAASVTPPAAQKPSVPAKPADPPAQPVTTAAPPASEKTQDSITLTKPEETKPESTSQLTADDLFDLAGE